MRRVDNQILEILAGCPNGATSTVILLHLFNEERSLAETIAELKSRGSVLERPYRTSTQGSRTRVEQISTRYFITAKGREELERHG